MSKRKQMIVFIGIGVFAFLLFVSNWLKSTQSVYSGVSGCLSFEGTSIKSGRSQDEPFWTRADIVVTNDCDYPISVSSVRIDAYQDYRHKKRLGTVIEKPFDPPKILTSNERFVTSLSATISANLISKELDNKAVLRADGNWQKE